MELEKENLEIAIAKEQIERPILSKEQIKYWIIKFRLTDLDSEEQKKKLIDVFVNAIYVYDDKMLITFNYKDGEKCLDFSDLQEGIKDNKTKNSDNITNTCNYQSSPLKGFGEPSAIRTRDNLIKSNCSRLLS